MEMIPFGFVSLSYTVNSQWELAQTDVQLLNSSDMRSISGPGSGPLVARLLSLGPP